MDHEASNKSVEVTEAQAKPSQPGTIAFEDAALVAQVRRGDMQAFGALVAKYQDRVVNTVYRICGHSDDAEELAQEAFLRSLEKIGDFRGESKFYTWLFRIATNLALAHRRRAGTIRFRSLTRDERYGGTQAENLTSAAAGRRDPGPEQAAISADNARKIAEALEELDDDSRVVVVLRDMEDMDYQTIAGVLDWPIGTVKSRIHRARCELREKLIELAD